MNYQRLMDQTKVYINQHMAKTGEITGSQMIDRYFLDKFGSPEKYKVEWVKSDHVQILFQPKLGKISQDLQVKSDDIATVKTAALEEIGDPYGDSVDYYFEESNRTLYLRKIDPPLVLITAYGWEIDLSGHWSEYMLIRKLNYDDWPIFEALYCMRKCILTIIDKESVRHMWE